MTPAEFDDEEEVEDEFGPGSPDYDLSESHGYRWEPKRDNWPIPPWLLAVVSLLIVLALLLPALLFLIQRVS